MWKKASTILCCLVVLGFSSKPPEVTKGKAMKHIEVALPSFPKDIDPVKVWSYYHYMLVQSLYSTLVRLNEKGELVSHLAKKWTVSADGKKIKIELYPNAKFSNGNLVTAKDVAFSLSRHGWPKSGSVIQGYLIDKIKGMKSLKQGQIPPGLKVVDKLHLEITLNKPYPPFMDILAMPGFSIVDRKDRYAGAGPMVGKFDKKNQVWKLKVNKDFYGKKTKLKSMNVRAVKGKESIEKSFRDKDIDIILGVPIGEVDKFKLPEDTEVQETDTLSFNHLFYNTKKNLFKDKKFRKDFGTIIQSLAWEKKYLTKFLKKQETFLPKGVMTKEYYEPRVSGNSINIEEFKNKWSKKYRGKSLKIVVVRGHYNQVFLDDLEKLLVAMGIKIDLKRLGGRDYMKTLRAEDYDMISGAYIGNFPDPDGFLEPLNPKSGMKYGTYNTSKVLKEIDKVRYTKDAKKRMSLYSKVLKKFESEWTFIPLYRMNFPIVHHKKLSIPDASYRYEAELWNVFWD